MPSARVYIDESPPAAAAPRPRGPPVPIAMTTVPLDGFVPPELPPDIDPAVFSLVLAAAHRVRTNEGEAHGAIFLLVPAGTDLDDVG